MACLERLELPLGAAILCLDAPPGGGCSVDTLHLAAFAAQRRARRVLDLGAGVGALGLGFHLLRPVGWLELLEGEPELAAVARGNLAASGVPGNVQCHRLGELPPRHRGQFDLVLMNPPYFETGRLPPEPRRAFARHGALGPFIQAAAAALTGKAGRVALAYPAPALEKLMLEAGLSGLVPKRMRFVHGGRGRAARLVLVELRRARQGGLVVESPLVEDEVKQEWPVQERLETGGDRR